MKNPIKVLLCGAGAALLGFLWQGPTAGVLAGVYTTLAARAVLAHSATRDTERARIQLLDALAAAAADLRAGLPPAASAAEAMQRWELSADTPGKPDPIREQTLRRFQVAWQLAERTGAPLADTLELLVVELRAGQRRRAQAAAQLAGARATAGVLTILPVIGLGMGYAIGSDPLRVLLHTPAGAVCAGTAVALQTLGLYWINRLVCHAAG